MSGAPAKPRLKISFSRNASFVNDPSATTPSTADIPPTPAGESSLRKTVKLKVSASQPPTPAEAPTRQTKAGRQPKPTQKLVESKKRTHDDISDDDDEDDDVPLSLLQHPATKIKLKPKNTPQLVVKPRGRPPVHPPGDGYDSEASDREIDPAIEEQFVLRMMPGENCDYVRWCMENGKMGVSKGQGGADVQLKFFEEDTRRAVLTVKGQAYAAVMVDLPTITESMKTWDRKNFMKSADICQMLLVYAPVQNELEARSAQLPKMLDTHFKWPHGLTPPMHDCVNRRFAKTISRKEIEDKEAEVERLLTEDGKAASTKWEWVDDRLEGLGEEEEEEDEDEELEDAEGEMDYFGGQHDQADNEDLEADLEAAFAEELLAMDATGITPADSQTPLASTQISTPAALQQSIEDEEEESEDDEDDDDDDDDDDEDLDDDEREARDQEQAVKSMIAQMEKQLAQRQAELEKTGNKILRNRLESQIKQLKSEIELKNKSIGLDPDD